MATTDFETQFSNIAYLKLQDKNTKLSSFLLGFEVIDSNDEGTKALGMFAFKVSDEFLYAPVFFISGDVKPLDLLYYKSKDIFIPFTEEWIPYLLKQKPVSLGGPVSDEETEFIHTPNLRMFTSSPGMTIAASLKKKASSMSLKKELEANTKRALDFLGESSVELKSKVIGLIKSNEELTNCLMDNYSWEDVKNAVYISHDNFVKKAKDKKIKVEILSPEDLETNVNAIKRLEPSDKEKIYQGELVILDNRDEEEKATVYEKEMNKVIQNPLSNGVYATIVHTGNFEECFISTKPKSFLSMYADNWSVIIQLQTNEMVLAPENDVWVKNVQTIDDYSKLFEQLKVKNISDGKIGGVYILIDHKLNTTMPFKIIQRTSDSSSILSYSIEPLLEYSDNKYRKNITVGTGVQMYGDSYTQSRTNSNTIINGHYGGQNLNSDYPGENTDGVDLGYFSMKIVVSPKKEGIPHTLNGDLIVPQSFKLVPLSPNKEFKLGTQADVQYLLMEKGVDEISVRVDGNEYSTKYTPSGKKTEFKTVTSKKAVLNNLINLYNLDGNDAINLSKEAENNPYKPICKFIKQSLNVTSNPEIYGRGDYNVQFPGRDKQDIKSSYPTELQHLKGGDPELKNFDTLQDILSLAETSGQQTVFDHGLLANLAITTDVASLVDKYIPDIQLAVDRLGRLLFLIWWRNDEFRNYFGLDKILNFEEEVKNNFNQLGSLVLKMKKKVK